MNFALDGFAVLLAESLWLSERCLRVRGCASKAKPQDGLYGSGKPEAFRKECGKTDLALILTAPMIDEATR